MSDDLADEPSGRGVSPTRKKISAAILIVLLAVLVIELRAGLGHRMSGAALQAAAPDGVFEAYQYSHADIKGMLQLWPAETLLKTGRDETEYRYSWFSILRPVLRPLMSPDKAIPETNIFLSVTNHQPAAAIRFGTEGPSAAELEADRIRLAAPQGADDESMPGMDEMPPGGGPGRRRGAPPADDQATDDQPGADQADEGAARQRPALDEAPAAENVPTASPSNTEETPPR